MKKRILLFSVIAICVTIFAYPQRTITDAEKESIVSDMDRTGDELYINDVRYLISTPLLTLINDMYLELYPEAGRAELTIAPSYGKKGTTRDPYWCKWRIIDNMLYLQDICDGSANVNRVYSKEDVKCIMTNYLQGEFCSEGLFAHQLSGVLYAKRANLVDMPHNVLYGSDEYWKPYNEWYAQPIYQLTFEKGNLVEMIQLKEVEDDNHAYMIVHQQPQFSEENDALWKYLKGNIKYPAECKEKRQEGKVEISFIVEKNGSVSEVSVWRSSGYAALDEAAKSAISAMPKWIKPGKKYGKTVRTEMILPIPFSIP